MTVLVPLISTSLIVLVALSSAETCCAFTSACYRSKVSAVRSAHHRLPSFNHYQASQFNENRQSLTEINLYRKFHDYAWNKIMSDSDAEIDTVPEELRYNTSPVKGAPNGTDVVANLRSISQFPFLEANEKDGSQVLRLVRSAFLETQSPTREALITPMTIHVLNFVSFPSPHIRDENGEYLGLPIYGADIVSLPGNKHLVAIDFQPVLSLVDDTGSSGKEKLPQLPKQYAHLESKLEAIHSKYQKSTSDSEPLLSWGGDIPPQAERFFSPYALWTRLGDDNAMDTVKTVVWKAFQEYTDLYLDLMTAVQSDINTGKLEVVSSKEQEKDDNNPVWKGQLDYLEYRRTNDPARPMLQRLYGNEWSESVIGNVLFPSL